MRKTIFVLLILLIPSLVFAARALNKHALQMKENYPADYQNTLYRHAVEKWQDDERMIIYEINRQADALDDFADDYRVEHTAIAFEAMKKYGYDGYQAENAAIMNQLRVFGVIIGVDKLIKLHCNWPTVNEEYDRQVRAKATSAPSP